LSIPTGLLSTLQVNTIMYRGPTWNPSHRDTGSATRSTCFHIAQNSPSLGLASRALARQVRGCLGSWFAETGLGVSGSELARNMEEFSKISRATGTDDEAVETGLAESSRQGVWMRRTSVGCGWCGRCRGGRCNLVIKP